MRPVLDIWRVGAGHRLSARLPLAALTLALGLCAAPAARAAGSGAGADAFRAKAPAKASSPACRTLLKAGARTNFKAGGGSSPTQSGCRTTFTGVPLLGIQDLNPVHDAEAIVGKGKEIVGGAVDKVQGFASDRIVEGFNAIIDFLFGGLQAAITIALIKWVITIPNLSSGHVGDLESNIAVGAAGLLAATMTISIVRFWGSGLTGDGGWAGAEGVGRAVVAGLLIGLWPRIFDLAVRLSNALQSGILNDAVEHQLKSLFQNIGKVGFFTGGVVPLFFSIVTAIVGMILMLALVAMKIVITSVTIVLFCATPLALVMWPIPELSGAARFCLRSLGTVLAIPVVWCLIFGAFAAIGADTFTFHNTGKDQGFLGTTLNVAVVRPLVTISLLYLTLVMPRRLLALAPFLGGGGGGGGFGRTFASYAAVRVGLQHTPRVGGAGMSGWKGNQSQRLQVFGNPVEKKAAAMGQSARESFDSAKAKGRALASKLPGVSQAAPGKTSSANGSAPPKGDQQGAAGAGQAGGGQQTGARQPAGAATSKNGMKLGEEPFYGPRTMQPTIAHNEAVASRQKEMDFASKSGKGVTDAQAQEAVDVLHRHRSPDRQLELSSGPVQVGGENEHELYSAAKRAAFYGDADRATGAFAEWSLSDNEQVSKTEKDAFWTLGNASPKQREEAFKSFERPSGATATAEHRPRSHASQATQPSPARAPHAQPRQGGDG